ncbi:MAG TPA: sugar phosphate isomerase/epimerase family protein [Verrucomicrobiae bacterium]
MKNLSRRDFLHAATLGGLATAAVSFSSFGQNPGSGKNRKMTIDLVCGAIGVSASQPEAIELAAKHGFESVGADGVYLASLSQEKIAELQAGMKTKGLVFGAAGLPLEFRQDDSRFAHGLKGLPIVAAGLERAGVKRISTWLSPGDGRLTYVQNFRQHAARLRKVALILKDSGDLRLGLEYVGPKTSWTRARYPFIHTMAEMKDLIGEIGTGNVGFLLDSWHWYHAGDTVEDLLNLKAQDVVAVDLNDAPAGIPKDQQVDNRRELPAATGVIDVGSFLKALNQIGYDGPVRSEPFNQAVNKMSKDDACAASAAALKKAFALLST